MARRWRKHFSVSVSKRCQPKMESLERETMRTRPLILELLIMDATPEVVERLARAAAKKEMERAAEEEAGCGEKVGSW